jgi:hypothetical protein
MLNNENSSILFALLSAFFAALTTIFGKIGVEAINPKAHQEAVKKFEKKTANNSVASERFSSVD